jgi:hypothetical protein
MATGVVTALLSSQWTLVNHAEKICLNMRGFVTDESGPGGRSI